MVWHSACLKGKSLAKIDQRALTFGWPVGSLTCFAVVVDLPLATTAFQNVFGTSETPVFYTRATKGIDRPLIAQFTNSTESGSSSPFAIEPGRLGTQTTKGHLFSLPADELHFVTYDCPGVPSLAGKCLP